MSDVVEQSESVSEVQPKPELVTRKVLRERGLSDREIRKLTRSGTGVQVGMGRPPFVYDAGLVAVVVAARAARA